LSATESVAFESPPRERAADTLGMWVFLGSEAMLFGAVILAYVVARALHADGFAGASKHLSFWLGSINTGVLLTSSLTMALADLKAESKAWRAARRLLIGAALLGLVFLAIKSVEYAEEISAGLAPLLGLAFRYDGPDPAGAALFFNLYFAMTGLHAAHLLSGIAVIAWVAAFWPATAAASRLRRATAIGLYWHFIDIVWVFLYPLLYLINR
jgi:cytochrome c oxidase subunit 3